MYNIKKILIVLCVVMISIFGFVACSDENYDNDEKTESVSKKKDKSDKSDESDEKFNGSDKTDDEKEKILIGTNAEFPPFEYIDNKNGVIGKYAGIDMEIAKAIAESIEKEPVIEDMSFDGLLMALKQGKVDCVISGMTITDERLKEVDFSIPYYKATQVMIVKNDSDIKSAQDMKDKKIGVVDGYTGQIVVRDILNFESSAFFSGQDAVMDLINDKLDVVVIDLILANKFIRYNDELKIVEDGETFESEEYGIAVQKGNKELLLKINAKINQLLEEERIDLILDNYY